MECAKCGAAVATGQSMCEACGAPLRHNSAAVPREEIAGLLAEATLLRTWGQYEEAINVGIRIVRLDAGSFPAHTLLGDLYRDQGNYREALGWYKLAVQLDPANEVVRRKLDEMIDHVFQGPARGADVPQVMINSDAQQSALLPSEEVSRLYSFQQLLRKLQPVHLVVGCTVLAMLIVLAVLTFPLLFSVRVAAHTGAPGDTHPRLSTPSVYPNMSHEPVTGSAVNAQVPPTVTPPPPDGVESAAGSAGTLSRPKADATNPSTAPTQASAINVPPIISHEVPPYQVPSSLSSSVSEDQHTADIRSVMEHTARGDPKMPFTVEKLIVDPRSGNITVEYSVPKVEGGTAQIKQGLLYAGFRLIWAAEPQSPATQLFTLRGNAFTADNRESSLALTADVTSAQADAARNANDYGTVSDDLTNPWWRPDLANTPL